MVAKYTDIAEYCMCTLCVCVHACMCMSGYMHVYASNIGSIIYTTKLVAKYIPIEYDACRLLWFQICLTYPGQRSQMHLQPQRPHHCLTV